MVRFMIRMLEKAVNEKLTAITDELTESVFQRFKNKNCVRVKTPQKNKIFIFIIILP